jgi:hypothetical protein
MFYKKAGVGCVLNGCCTHPKHSQPLLFERPESVKSVVDLHQSRTDSQDDGLGAVGNAHFGQD